jgi:hypothetical protein
MPHEAPPVRDLLGAVMADENTRAAGLLDVVALLADQPGARLARAQVGTVVDLRDAATVLVEFSDDDGRAYAVAPCPRADLLLLRYVPEPA